MTDRTRHVLAGSKWATALAIDIVTEVYGETVGAIADALLRLGTPSLPELVQHVKARRIETAFGLIESEARVRAALKVLLLHELVRVTAKRSVVKDADFVRELVRQATDPECVKANKKAKRKAEEATAAMMIRSCTASFEYGSVRFSLKVPAALRLTRAPAFISLCRDEFGEGGAALALASLKLGARDKESLLGEALRLLNRREGVLAAVAEAEAAAAASSSSSSSAWGEPPAAYPSLRHRRRFGSSSGDAGGPGAGGAGPADLSSAAALGEGVDEEAVGGGGAYSSSAAAAAASSSSSSSSAAELFSGGTTAQLVSNRNRLRETWRRMQGRGFLRVTAGLTELPKELLASSLPPARPLPASSPAPRGREAAAGAGDSEAAAAGASAHASSSFSSSAGRGGLPPAPTPGASSSDTDSLAKGPLRLWVFGTDAATCALRDRIVVRQAAHAGAPPDLAWYYAPGAAGAASAAASSASSSSATLPFPELRSVSLCTTSGDSFAGPRVDTSPSARVVAAILRLSPLPEGATAPGIHREEEAPYLALQSALCPASRIRGEIAAAAGEAAARAAGAAPAALLPARAAAQTFAPLSLGPAPLAAPPAAASSGGRPIVRPTPSPSFSSCASQAAGAAGSGRAAAPQPPLPSVAAIEQTCAALAAGPGRLLVAGADGGLGEGGRPVYAVHFRNVIREVQRRTLFCMMADKFGDKSARLMSLLWLHGALDEKAASERALLTPKETRELLYALVREGWVSVQDVPKRPDHHPQFTVYVYCAAFTDTMSRALGEAHHAMLNMRIRRRMARAQLEELEGVLRGLLQQGREAEGGGQASSSSASAPVSPLMGAAGGQGPPPRLSLGQDGGEEGGEGEGEEGYDEEEEDAPPAGPPPTALAAALGRARAGLAKAEQAVARLLTAELRLEDTLLLLRDMHWLLWATSIAEEEGGGGAGAAGEEEDAPPPMKKARAKRK